MGERQKRGDAGSVAQLVIPYCPRSIWETFHASRARFRVAVAHRRAGKTVALVNELLKGTLVCNRPRPRFGYVAPYSASRSDGM